MLLVNRTSSLVSMISTHNHASRHGKYPSGFNTEQFSLYISSTKKRAFGVEGTWKILAMRQSLSFLHLNPPISFHQLEHVKSFPLVDILHQSTAIEEELV